MARGHCETAFALAAQQDGVELTRARVPWLNQRGHFGLPEQASPAVAAMRAIFEALGGIEWEMAGKRMTALPGDFVHLETGVYVEVDESQHFTSFRLVTLNLYPETTPLGFDLPEYKRLCQQLAPRSDRYRRDKPAVGFGPGGRQRQRAYNDALRDLMTPAMGYAPVIRVAAPDGDGVTAYVSVRTRLRAATGIA
ncbi:hypothetical protein ACFQU3_19415 [Terrabacter sp. GCM10028922]|uniref:DUF7255 family protein n=1 Tax=Terrabacter sp. GCM10028922 TaxID=3273428 RepID=UPI003607A14B